MDRKLTEPELIATKAAMNKYGLPDAVDTGTGVTGTSFYPPPGELPGDMMAALTKDMGGVLPGSKKAYRANVDSYYAEDLTGAWKAGEGSGKVSQEILDKINVTPELRAAFDNNPDIAENALNYISRDKDLAKQFGTTVRKDLQKLRSIIGSGPGWVTKLEAAVKKGVVPGIAAAFLTSAYGEAQNGS